MAPGRWKDPFCLDQDLTFGANLMPLIPSSMIKEFNNFILKEKIDPWSNSLVQIDQWKSDEPSITQGVPCVWMIKMEQGGPYYIAFTLIRCKVYAYANIYKVIY